MREGAPMLLTLDIGNAVTTLGGFEDERLLFVARMKTDLRKTEDEYAAGMSDILALHGVSRESVNGAILASVVPPLTAVMKRAVSFLFGVTPLVVGPGIKTGIGIHCDDPSSVGADLIAGCVAAHALYGSPSLVIDMGMATNLTLMKKGGIFSGASIMAGVGMGLSALAGETAQLPYVSLESPRAVIGKNTADCMRSGVVYGNASMLDGMIDRVYAELDEEIPVIITGEYAPVILPHLTHAVMADETLVLKGLQLLYRKNKT